MSSTGTLRRNSRSNAIPSPVAIPNLTKKSRGRRVPTSSMVAMGMDVALIQFRRLLEARVAAEQQADAAAVVP